MSVAAEKNEIISPNPKVNAVYHTAEWLLSAFASVLVFIVFVMQVYRIPTGSMAPTLRGAHFRVRCAACGYQYGHDFIASMYGYKDTMTPTGKQMILHQVQAPPGMPNKFISSRCPSCGYAEPPIYRDASNRVYMLENNRIKPPHLRTVFKGDQIFVLKCIYQFFQPKRWDVIVFKNPTEPRINYIKRCIGLPNETIQIVDGDVYADGIIQRKPEKVQDELWMIIYNNDYPPVNPRLEQFNGHTWQQPFENVGDSTWNTTVDDATVFTLATEGDEPQRLQYNDEVGNSFQATYAYDDPRTYYRMPVCSDLMIEYYPQIGPASEAGGQISKYGMVFQGWLDADGRMRIVRIDDAGNATVLRSGQCGSEDLQQPMRFRFATLDHQVVLTCGSTKLVQDLGTEMDIPGADPDAEPSVQVLGTGTLRLEHIALYRDIHYISNPQDMGVAELRGSRDNPMVLGDDQFFACGDNSPFSADSRVWGTEGIGNNGETFPKGVVPKQYLVGKGLVVHWPGGFRLGKEPIRWIPNIDDMKVIYGGKD